MSLKKARIVDPVLTELQTGFVQPGLIGTKILQVVPVTKEAGIIPRHGKQALRDYKTERAIKAASNRRNRDGVDTVDFKTTEHDIEDAIDYREKTEDHFDLRQDAMEDNQTIIDSNREREIAALVTTPANYAAGNTEALVGTDKFSDPASKPWVLVEQAKQVVRKETGELPVRMFISASGDSELRMHEGMKAILSNDTTRVLTSADIKAIFQLEEYHVGSAVTATGDDDELVDIWGDTCGLYNFTKARTAKKRNLGYTLEKKKGSFVDTYMEQGGKIEVVRNTSNFGTVLVSATDGYLFTEII